MGEKGDAEPAIGGGIFQFDISSSHLKPRGSATKEMEEKMVGASHVLWAKLYNDWTPAPWSAVPTINNEV